MGDKPAKYWDVEECRWVEYPAVSVEQLVPAQPGAETDRSAPHETPSVGSAS